MADQFLDLNGEIRLQGTLVAPGGLLPAGGTTGQVLTKESNADGDADWATGGVTPPVAITGTDPATVPLTVTGAAGQATDLFAVRTSDALVFEIGSNGSISLQPSEGNISLFSPNGISLENDNASEAVSFLSFGGVVFVALNAAPASANLSAGAFAPWLDSTNGAAKLMVAAKQADGTVVAPGLTGRDIATAPAVSAASTLALGTAYQNTLGYDVLLCIYLSVTVNTSGVLKLGVGPTTTPTQQTLVTGITSTGLWPVPIYLPNQYYALLSTTGTITVAVDGQIAMPV